MAVAPVHAEPAGAPSVLCHVSDCAFTTCPGGGREWSNVPFTAFAETQTYLYADQSDQDPALHTPTSPLDTFMLMYDECGRRTPLSSSEYVLVSFKTVEVHDGREQLAQYAVHLFPDGTI